MKRITITILLCLIAISGMCQIYEIDGINYRRISLNEVEVVTSTTSKQKRKLSGHIVIPQSVIINGSEFLVKSIHSFSFSYTNIESITIAEGIKSIGEHAFVHCEKLISVKLPNSIEEIGGSAFEHCKSLQSINIPTGVTSIGGYAFSHCHSLTKANIPGTVDTIKHHSFSDCFNLSAITIDEGVKVVGEGAFSGCRSLNRLVIPNSVCHIEETAFWSCESLKTIVVPDDAKIDLTEKGYDAFLLCSSLTTIRGHNIPYPSWIVEHLASVNKYEPIYFWVKEGEKVLASDIAQANQSNVKPLDDISSNSNIANNKNREPVTPHLKIEENKKTSTNINQVIDNSIDQHVPVSSIRNDRTFAIIIGNENYKEVEPVPHALNDARIFAIYCEKTLGIPSKNIKVYEDATFGTILSAIDYIQQVAKAFQGDINIIFYYAGHGVPSESTNEAYLLPVDANGRNIAACYQIEKLYSELKNLNANQVTVFLDACFSGAQRGTGMLASSRGIAFNTKQAAPQGNMVVFSAASADETAYPFAEKGHGLFTYYLLKKLNETKGNVTLGELGRYICEKVAQESIVTNGKSQTPTVVPSANISTSWMEMKLVK